MTGTGSSVRNLRCRHPDTEINLLHCPPAPTIGWNPPLSVPHSNASLSIRLKANDIFHL